MVKPAISNKVQHYPSDAQATFLQIRSLIFNVAKAHNLGDVHETLKWGQPSYLCKSGSTIRIDWQSRHPDSVGIFFNCKTVLVETFKEIFKDALYYRGNRVVVVALGQPLPAELETCILMALNYHKLKKQVLLGA